MLLCGESVHEVEWGLENLVLISLVDALEKGCDVGGVSVFDSSMP